MSSEGTAAEYGTHNLIAIYLLSKTKKKKKNKNKKQNKNTQELEFLEK